ncbi:ABC transporter ATP-binding protein [Candidatus Uhrbacteria bacterium]|nr:ABC transporter ATP-binding protein [Candidatus Uhrbacteria bacterium]
MITENKNSILEVKGLSKSFDGVHAVAGMSCSIEKGTITSIIGPNGSGKTTLTNCVTGMMPFDGGVLCASGVELARIVPHDVPTYGIARTFQNIRLFEQMIVRDNLLVVLTERAPLAALFERHSPLHEEQAEELLRHVGLWEKRDVLASRLSYGQRKLLEIARALAMRPLIIFFDEPFAGLFPEMVKTVVGIMKEFREQGGTIILIEHAMDLIRELSDHVIVMDAGTVLAEGAPAEVLSRTDVMEAYLGG